MNWLAFSTALGSAYASAKRWALAHLGWSILIGAVILYGLWYGYGVLTAPSTVPKYITTDVATSTVVATMVETGQVSATSNIDLASQSSGAVTSVAAAPGKHVAAGAVILTIDPTNAYAALVSAQQDLESAQIALAKLQEAAATSTLTQSQNSVATAQANLTQAHQSSYNDISSAFLDLPAVMNTLDTTLHGTVVPGRSFEQNENAYSDMIQNYDSTVTQFETTSESNYQTAYAAYEQNLSDFKATPRGADDATIEALGQETYQTAASISDALKATSNFLNFVSTTLTNQNLSVPSVLNSQIATLTSITGQTNSHVAALSSDVSSITADQRSLAAAQASLSQLQDGPDPLDVQSAQLNIAQRQAALVTAQQNYADTVIRAPFAGTVAAINVQKYQNIGNGTTVATIVSDNQTADLSLNEVDAAKLALGQKATLTFDALPDITIGGTVSSINSLGTVSNGVVSYDAVITFDTANPSVLPGMSMTASIITGTATGLVLPSSAVKTSNGQSYVLVFNPSLAGSDTSTAGVASTIAPTAVPVTLGLSNNTQVLVTGGLTAGEQVVTRTIATATQTTTSSTAAPSLFSAVGGRTVGGGAGARPATGATTAGAARPGG